MNANWLSRKLRPFAVYPRTIRTGVGKGETAKGYQLEDFDEPFDRYLPDLPPANRHTVTTPANTGESSTFETVTASEAVTLQNQHETLDNIELLRSDTSNTPHADEVLL